MGGVGGGGGGWEAQGRLNHSLVQGKSCCVFSKAQKQPQCTCQSLGAQFDTTCSLISVPHVAPHTPQWTVMNLHDQINAACESRPGHPHAALSLVCLDSARVWLSC